MMFGFDTVIVRERASAGSMRGDNTYGPTKPTKKQRRWLVDEIRELKNEKKPLFAHTSFELLIYLPYDQFTLFNSRRIIKHTAFHIFPQFDQ